MELIAIVLQDFMTTESIILVKFACMVVLPV